MIIFFGSIDDPNSLLLAQMRIEEIRQQRKDFKVKIHDFQTNTDQEILRRFRLSLLETKLTWGLKQERLLQKIYLSDPSPIIGNACQWLTHSLTHWRLVNSIDVTLACEDANSKLVEVVTVADVDA